MSHLPLFPIRSDADLSQATKCVDALWGSEVGTYESDLLNAWACLIEDYENKYHPFPPVAEQEPKQEKE